ncbi:MAG TPA: heavy metal translocating P-type ATPase [Candidatus Dormibacteraeota bacterium]|nr:heavy metal translocating P-type ATPase [Candidatus Dormibacteraeota bacterium]
MRLRLPSILLAQERRSGIARALDEEPHVQGFRFAPACRSLIVEHDGELSTAAVIHLVLRAKPASPPAPLPRGGRRPPRRWLALGVGGALAVAGTWVAVPFLLAAAAPIFHRALVSISRHRRLNVDALDSGALLLTMLGGHLVTAAAVIGMVEGGEWMRDVTAARSRRALGELIADREAVVTKVVGAERVPVRVADLQPGDVVVLAPGDHVPVDGFVLSGEATVDERFLTGEPLPVRRSEGDRVFAMTVVVEGELQIVAGTDVQHSRAGRIVDFLERAPIGDTRMSDHVRQIGDRFVLPVLGLGAAVLAATGSPSRTASVITFDLVTGVRVSAPTTMLASLTASARDGVLIKGAAALEALARVDAIVFDKTGTLTAGRPRIVGVHSFCGLDADDLLTIAASADHSLRHPLAVALCAEAAARGLAPVPPRERRYQVGLGVEAQLDGGATYLVGNRLLMRRHGVRLAPLPPDLDPYGDATRVWVARPPHCLGAVLMRDVQRQQARQVIDDLRARGVRHLMLLSGDGEGAARHIAESLGLDEWRARATPEGKARAVRELRRRGFRVAVIGDGINDSLAFTRADVGVAMGHGSDVASSTAQVVLIDDDLTLLPRALDRAREAVRLMRQNLAVIAAPNLLGLIVALVVPMSPAVAGVLSNGSTILAALNGLRPLHRPPVGPPRPAG